MAEIKWTAAQRDAIEAGGRNIYVAAAAGSGKTAVLTRRIIERICSPEIRADISRMLIVTFTRAAADELKSRIGAAIEKEKLDNPGDRHLRRQALLLPCAKISTVHSFCLDLIRANFRELGLPSDFHAADETVENRIFSDTAEELISDYYEGKISGEYAIENFRLFVNTFGSATDDEALPKTVGALYRSLCDTPDGIESLSHYGELYRSAAKADFMTTPWGEPIRRYLSSAVKYYEEIFSRALAYIGENPEYAPYEETLSGELALLRSLDAENMSYDELCDKINGYTPAKIGTLRRGTEKSPEILFFVAQRDAFKAEMKSLRSEYFCFSAADIAASFEFTARAAADLRRFLLLFDARFSEEKRRKKLITFADMERYALTLLWDRENDGKTDIARAVSEQFDEIYVDEYQDINAVQNKIFSLVSRGDNFFAVGDIKQSIYGFRGGRPDIFKGMTDSAQKYRADMGEGEAKVFLSENFRSCSEVLGYANRVFAKLMNVEGASGYGEDERLVCGRREGSAPVEICVVEKETTAADDISSEADYVAAKIRSLIGQPKRDGELIKPGDIAILLRSAERKAPQFERALKKYGIPCESTGTGDFFENPEVLLAFSLLNTVDNPSKDAYLAATLKSPLYGVTLDELIYIRRSHSGGSLYEALKSFTESTGFAKGERFLADNAKYRSLASALPADKLIWQIYTETGILCLPHGADIAGKEVARANLMQFYRWSMDYGGGNICGLHSFLGFIEDAIESGRKITQEGAEERYDCVKITTIHSSKGLEYPICFLCDCAAAISDKDAAKSVLFSPELGIAPKIPSENGFYLLDTPLRRSLICARRTEISHEESRLLYVALTRARERLFITAQVPAKAGDTADDIYDTARSPEFSIKHDAYSLYLLATAPNYLNMLLCACPNAPEMKLNTVRADTGGETAEQSATETQAGEDILPYQAEVAVRRLDFEYAYGDMTKIPSKLSVSKLYPTIFDEDDGSAAYEETAEEEATEEAASEIKIPKFLMDEPDEDATAAQRGTAMHTFMQFADFDNVYRSGIEAERDRLIEQGYLFASDREKLDIGRLSAFFSGETARMIREAKRVYREKRFLLNYPAALFTEDEEKKKRYAGEEVLVQGVIDCVIFDKNGETVLIDYKTDSFRRGTDAEYIKETLRRRHRLQLGYYKYACEKMFGKPVSRVLIYSFALGDAVEIYDL